MTTYQEKLKDPKWQKKRLEIFQRDDWKCTECKNDQLTLHVHHDEYGGDPWDTPDYKLKTLCEYCHLKKAPKILQIKAFLEKLEISGTIAPAMRFDTDPEKYLISLDNMNAGKKSIIRVFDPVARECIKLSEEGKKARDYLNCHPS